MNLIERYVEAVKRYLPARVREDVGRELCVILEEKAEAAAERTGRELTDEEVAQLLREHGHPYEVALAYRPRRVLVGERSYPLYRRVLASSLAIYLLVAVALALLRLDQHQGAWALALVPQFLQAVGDALLFGFFVITVIFHFFGEYLAKSAFFWRWDPRRLPEIAESWANIPLPTTFVNVIATVVWLCALTAAQSYATPGVEVRVDPVAFAYFLPLRLLLLGLLALFTLNLFQRYWTRVKLILFVALAAGVVVYLIAIVAAPSILHFVVTAPADPARLAAANRWGPLIANLTLRIALAIIATRVLYDATVSLFRAVRKQSPLL